MSTRLYLVLLAAVAIAGCGSHDARHDALEVASDRASMDEVEHDGDGPAEGLGEGLTHLLNDGAEEVGDLSEARNSGEVDELLLQDETEADTLSCDCPPPALSVTVNRIPVDMNGSVPFLDNAGTLRKFHLALPTYGFAVDLDVVCPCGCDIDGGTFSFDVQTGEEMPGANHWELAEWTEGKGGGAVGKALTGRLWVGEELELDEAEEVLLTGTAVDLCGKESEVAALQVETVEMTPLLHPFDIEDPWLLTYHRDHYAIQLVIDDVGSAYVTAKEGANGIDDFIEDLWMAGMGTPYPSAEFAAVECDGGTGGNECLARELLERTRIKAYHPFQCGPDGAKGPDSVNIRFYIEGEPAAPDPATFQYQFLDQYEGGAAPEGKAFSILGFGGGDLKESWVGMSETVDVHNIRNENNGKHGYGCFTTSLVRFFYEYVDQDPGLYALAKMALADLLPSMGGVAIGEMPGDELVIDFSLADEDLPPELLGRRKTLDTLLEVFATGLGALAAHEIGHSIGLVPKGAPPVGLFGGEKLASFIENPAGSVGPHIDTAGPNLMQAGPGSGNSKLDISMLLTPFFFNELNLSYLQGRLVVK